MVASLTGHTHRVLYLAMSPDGETIVTGAGGSGIVSAGPTLVVVTASDPTVHAALTAANLLATVLRFVLLRGWVFRTRRAAHADRTPVRPASPRGGTLLTTTATTSETTR